jgi:hypothetical protein
MRSVVSGFPISERDDWPGEGRRRGGSSEAARATARGLLPSRLVGEESKARLSASGACSRKVFSLWLRGVAERFER